MFFHFRVLLHTLLFFGIMQLAVYNNQRILYWSALMIVATLWGIRKITKRYIYSAIPVTLSVSAMMMLYLIDSMAQKHVFSVLALIIFYWSLLGIFRLKGYSQDQTARGIVAASLAGTMFIFYSASYGLYLNFVVPLWVLMIVFSGVTFLVSFEYFSILNPERREVAHYSLILAMLMGEITWVINFWPFGYLTTGTLAMIFYFLFWDLTQSHFLNNLSQKRLVKNVILLGMVAGMVLVTSRWLPAV